MSYTSLEPKHSENGSQRLLNKVKEPVLMIAIGHNGIAAAIQAALYATQRGCDILFIPVRHSRRDHKDKRLHLPDAESIAQIQEAAAGRTVVAYDEVTSNGTTLAESTHQLRHEIVPGTTVIGIVNVDIRTKHQREVQGEWWENSVPPSEYLNPFE